MRSFAHGDVCEPKNWASWTSKQPRGPSETVLPQQTDGPAGLGEAWGASRGRLQDMGLNLSLPPGYMNCAFPHLNKTRTRSLSICFRKSIFLIFNFGINSLSFDLLPKFYLFIYFYF